MASDPYGPSPTPLAYIPVDSLAVWRMEPADTAVMARNLSEFMRTPDHWPPLVVGVGILLAWMFTRGGAK